MTLFSDILGVLRNLAGPWILISMSIQHIPQTISSLLADGRYGAFFSPSAFSDALFGNFWATFGPEVRRMGERRVVPLLQGRIRAGQIHDDVVGRPVSGIVIEVGAGSGMWADLFASVGAVAEQGKREGLRDRGGPGRDVGGLTKVYGVEPNAKSAAALRKRVQEVGLGDIYEVVPVGIQDVGDSSKWDGRIEPGSVDCIAGILCLCSIPDPEDNIKALYKLLKPGGRWYVYEHVRADRGGFFMRAYQRLVSWPWSIFMGSCRICRCTGNSLLAAGPWKEVDLVHPVDEPLSSVLPHIIGTLTKPE